MGYKPGTSLGKTGTTGIVEPVAILIKGSPIFTHNFLLRGRIFKDFRNLESIPWSRFRLRNQVQVGIDSKGWSRVGQGYTLFHLGTGLDN